MLKKTYLFAVLALFSFTASQAQVVYTNQISDIISKNQLVIVDFFIPKCSACDFMSPIFERVSNMLQGVVTFVKVNARDNVALGQSLGIRKVPAFLYFKNGTIINRHTGSVNPLNGQSFNDQSFSEYVKSIFGV